MTISLGISCFYHDSAASLVIDGKVVAATHEERFSRRRHDPSFPRASIEFCLARAGVALRDVDEVSYYEDPREKSRRVWTSALASAPRGSRVHATALTGWLGRKRRADREVRDLLREMGDRPGREVRVYQHHLSHAASAYYPSPYTSAAVLCIDSVGEWATTSIWHATPAGIEPVVQVDYPHSLGLLYSAFTYFCGFKVDSGEYKLMGLAPYGKPRYAEVIRRELIDVKPDGSFRLNYPRFEFIHGSVMTGAAFERLFGGPRREPETPLTEREFDLAASVQQVTEEVVTRLARTARRLTGERHLTLAGGVALNCVANGVISREGVFDSIWVQPAAGDAGGSLGAALLSCRDDAGRVPRPHLGEEPDGMSGARLGPEYTPEQIEQALSRFGAVYERLGDEEMNTAVAQDLLAGRVVGWHQGRMEFGPRALGARSILGDPRSADTQTEMNLRIKFRESFRPFAPSVLAERAGEFFDLNDESPYMLMVSPVAQGQRRPVPPQSRHLEGLDLLKVPRSSIPAVTHVDHSARVQTVTRRQSPRYYALLEEFERLSGCPMVVNTSFNVRGEPIVNTPEEAYTCFMRTDIDSLAIGPFYLSKAKQPVFTEETDWRESVPLD
ncbi:carbamoyltransferase [Kineosporia sp. J2-2]|uniref:Carbamoyltransferase n=1 Tax=Kineosporia corallincola TaxID=2835133 RepID=A0ABS5TQC9_9ACTN|nr:carbamoyltransferase [Kineosporia corallincola]MBT0773317.1 carbamoyltransferase [Kineosporia corallincola]